MGYIYCITSPSGKRYIGQTERHYEKRFREHCALYNCCILLERAIRKYGKDNMKFEILLMIDNELLNEYEIKFIQLYNTIEPSGYNIRTGGVNAKHSDASKQRMREAKLGDKNHNFGKPRTDETKKKISLAKQGEKHHFFGKELSYEHKLNLSKAHKTSDLPMYLVYLKARPKVYQYEGYAVTNHPNGKNKHFTSKTLTLEEKYKLGINYLNELNNL